MGTASHTSHHFYLIGLIVFLMPVLTIHPVQSENIGGFIMDGDSGVPITGLDLNLYDSNWNYISIPAMTDNGYYVFFDVPPGDYYVKANPKYPFHYIAEYWDNALSREEAVLITLTPGIDLTNIDFELSHGDFIGGKILNMEEQPLNRIDINIYDRNWKKVDTDAGTDPFGKYFIGGLAPGEYYVLANPIYAQPYVDQYYDHANGPLHAVLVTVTGGNDVSGIDFNLADGTYIEGDIRDLATSEALQGISVKAYNENGSKMRLDTHTNELGHYILGAYLPGSYFVRADPGYPSGYMDQYYPGSYRFEDAQAVEIAMPKPLTGIDLNLPAGSYISGLVQTLENVPLEDIKIKFYDDVWFEYELTTTRSKSDGYYRSGALKPGEYFVKAVPVFPQPYIDEYYSGAIEPENALAVVVSLDGETLDIDFDLSPGGYLSGTVLNDISGSPLFDIDLDIYNADWDWVDYSDHTNSKGKFLIGAVPFGQYYLRCDPSEEQNFIPYFYQDAFWSEDAVSISLTDGNNAENLDFSLAQGGQINGRVTDQNGAIPIKSVEILAYSPSWKMLPLHRVTSGSDGMYTLYGIPSGQYYIMANPNENSGYEPEYYAESSTQDGSVLVSVTAGDATNGIDFTLSQPVTPTPPLQLGVQMEMPRTFYRSGDLFYVNAMIFNPGATLGVRPLYVLLDVLGNYYFWPSWRFFDPPEYSKLDWKELEITPGAQLVQILAPFEWPKTGNAMNDIAFYGALLSQDHSQLLGNYGFCTFGFSD